VPRKTKKTPDIVAAVAANVKKDWPVTCKDITFAYGGIQWDKAQHSLRKPRADQEWFFHWNKILVPTADIMLMWMTANKIQQLQHPPYLLDLAPEAYFFFSGVKEVLAGAVLTLESFKKIWGGVGRNIDIDHFATAFSL
jgi:hypothetical protein